MQALSVIRNCPKIRGSPARMKDTPPEQRVPGWMQCVWLEVESEPQFQDASSLTQRSGTEARIDIAIGVEASVDRILRSRLVEVQRVTVGLHAGEAIIPMVEDVEGGYAELEAGLLGHQE